MKKVLLIICLLFLGGCGDYHEVENLTIVTAVAIDKTENDMIEICVELVKFTDASHEATYIKSSGTTYTEAVNNAIKVSGNDLFFSHTAVMILSEDFARGGIMDMLNTIYRSSKLRLDMNLLIAKDINASDILMTKSVMDDVSGMQIKEMIEINNKLSKTPTKPLYEFINDVTSEGVCGYLPTISVVDEARKIVGLSLFDEDRLSGFIDEKQTAVFGLIQSTSSIGEYTTSSSQTSFLIENSKCKIIPEIIDNKLQFIFDVDVKLSLTENGVNLEDRQKLDELTQEVCQSIKSDINGLITVVRENSNSDFLGLGSLVYRKYTDEWGVVKASFPLILEYLDYEIIVNCDIVGGGLISSPLTPKS